MYSEIDQKLSFMRLYRWNHKIRSIRKRKRKADAIEVAKTDSFPVIENDVRQENIGYEPHKSV